MSKLLLHCPEELKNLHFNFTWSEDATTKIYEHLKVSSFMVHNYVLRVHVVNYAICLHSRNSGCVKYTFILPWAQRYQPLDQNLQYLHGLSNSITALSRCISLHGYNPIEVRTTYRLQFLAFNKTTELQTDADDSGCTCCLSTHRVD